MRNEELGQERLSSRDRLAYAVPAIAYGFYLQFMIVYVMKYSTDVLLISASVIGALFGLARLWDTFSDPLVGYLSDRTRLSFGRRRPWILAGALPLALTGIMLFTQPDTLSTSGLSIWVGVALIGVYTALTAIQVPHYAWGAELTPNYHERNRLFGAHTVAQYVGALLAIAGLAFVIGAESGQAAAVSQLSVAAGVVAFVLIVVCVLALKETQGAAQSPRTSLLRSFQQVWRNPHARTLLIVNFIERTGYSTIGVLTLYVADYVLNMPELSILIIAFYLVSAGASTPLWVWLAGRHGKANVWFAAMLGTGVGFTGMFGATFLDQSAQLVLMPIVTLIVGAAAGCGSILSSSVLSDVIDYDELETGERREGAYFACWNFTVKFSVSFMALIVGIVLDLAGYVPGAAQSFTVILTIMVLYCLFPAAAHFIGAWLFKSKFRFSRGDHDAVRKALTERRAHASHGT
ncbi:MAG: glycoside-pentoside-hexuronide (GPH):cation symporter [Gammaproteobacteria bacterium]|nr:glycoside-pentoside-hexuronide (GPH):cation symporter [Gammaproteobacteria bacterium]